MGTYSIGVSMPIVIIKRADVVQLVEAAARKFTGGDKTEAVAQALQRFLEQGDRRGSLFGAHRGSVRVRRGIDLTTPHFEP